MSRRKRDARLLQNLAGAMNACERAGLSPEANYGVIITSRAYVLFIKDRWVVRKLRHHR
jgi:hypothetical protein